MLKLRDAAGKAIGCNLDPSHLWWQGIDPVGAIKILGKENAIHHFHAKDTFLDQDNINMYGLTDMQPYGNVQSRSWTFRSVGCGHSIQEWSDIISALRLYGYDYVLSIEHEDPLMSIDEGFDRAVTNLKSIMIKNQPTDMWWA
jgi:sugar phosphate isomerase/epimerase